MGGHLADPLKKRFVLTANRIVLGSFLIIIFAGALLLYLSRSTYSQISIFEALFTAVSITCVTGLSIVDIANFTSFGQAVILGLMQIGGLGLMTISFFVLAFVNKQLSVNNTSIARKFFSLDSAGKVKQYLKIVLLVTAIVELTGALILLPKFLESHPLPQAILQSLFYSVSAFCNCGVTLAPEGLKAFLSDHKFILTLVGLSTMGNLGFLFFNEIYDWLKNYFIHKKGQVLGFSLNVKIVTRYSFWLLASGSVFFYLTEKSKLFGSLDLATGFLHSFFYNVFLRSSGFALFDINSLSNASLFFSLICMVIGSGPGSTGGGIKMTTFAVFGALAASIIKGSSYVEIGYRTVSQQQIYKTISILLLFGLWAAVSTFLLLIAEADKPFFAVFFESCSALTNVGLSTGITKHLSLAGKIILMFNMLAGRIGILTFVLAINKKSEQQSYKYPSEYIILG